jgi:ppGpp synthetase/RelA/SpoT-type nucleotidyltranferase
MTTTETELRERWARERPMYDAWGSFVCATLTDAIASKIDPAKIELFFRIPIKYRTKEEASLLAKAFHRGKKYTAPYDNIEDKVGVRIVVLFSDEIRVVEKVINECDQWIAQKARDYEEERAKRPFEFDYQSLHYIVRAKGSIRHHDIDIVEEIPCEIQIRTILQHAYSELTHDTIYKPSVQAESQVKRAAAKSMALIEATDDYFMQVRERLAQAQAPDREIASILIEKYRELVNLEPDSSPLNTLIVDYFKRWAKEQFSEEFSQFLNEKNYLAEIVRERAPGQFLYRQSGILLVYWAISQAPHAVAEGSLLSDAELAPLYSDLGERLPTARI